MEDNIFDKRVLTNSLKDLQMDINELLDEVAPSGKTNKDFTGGYVQQLKNSNQLVAYFGTKVGTNNRDTVKISIPSDELDLFYMMLKSKIHEMQNINTKTVKVSMAARRLARLEREENITNESQEEICSVAAISPASNEKEEITFGS
ncbi:MAG: hypothetical protein DRG78_02860 [Epsilonproteobacteria bacterium]|nr:MAG: hypothetical protein DRG78_02860 [Campylobacterota bacterium]